MQAFERFAKDYDRGEVIFFEHEPGDSFYLIQSGRVKIVKIMGEIEKIIDILQPGEFFGEMAILENAPRSATIITVEPCKLLEFNKENFSALIQNTPQVGINLLKIFARRIYDQKRRLMILTLNDTEARVGDVFLMLDEMLPKKDKDKDSGKRVFQTTIEDITHWAGLPLKPCKDVLDHFIEVRRIVIDRNSITVTNINEIKRFVTSKRRLQEEENH